MSEDSHVQYVRSSSVRTDIISELCSSDRETVELLSDLDASESAVYDALSHLEGRGLVLSRDSGWTLTGTGRLVADIIHQQRLMDDFIDTDTQYWEAHDTSVLPEPFRLRLSELGSYEIIRGTQADINRPVREVTQRVKSVESCSVVSPVYHPEYRAAMPDSPDSRLVVSGTVIDDLIDSETVSLDETALEETAVRVSPISYALVVSDDWIILTLPEIDGTWPSAKIVSKTAAAISWASDLFESVWTNATPRDQYQPDY